jgi:hypothetical protein
MIISDSEVEWKANSSLPSGNYLFEVLTNNTANYATSPPFSTANYSIQVTDQFGTKFAGTGTGTFDGLDFPVTVTAVVPEPSTLVFLAAAAAVAPIAILVRRWRQRGRSALAA